MKLVSVQHGAVVPSQRHAFRPVLVTNRSKSADIAFSGTARASTLLALAFASLFGLFVSAMPSKASDPPQSPPGKTLVVSRTDGAPAINEKENPFVDSARQLPVWNNRAQNPILDLLHSPAFTDSQRAQLTEFIQQDGNRNLVVVVPDSHVPLATLAENLSKQLGIKREVLFVLNKTAIEQGRSDDRMALHAPEHVRSLAGQKAVELLQKHAIPALQEKNPDKAITETLKALQEMRQVSTGAIVAGIAIALLIGFIFAMAAKDNPALLLLLLSMNNGSGGGGGSSGGV